MPPRSSHRAPATRRLLRPSLAAAVSLVALVLSGLLIGAVGEAERTPSATDSLPDGYDSSTVAELADEFGADDSAVAIVLFTADDGTLSTEMVEGELTALYGQVVASETSQQGDSGQPAQQQPLQVSEDATAALGVVPIGTEGASETADAVEQIRTLLDDQTPDGVNAQVTGPAAVQADLAGVFEGADVTLLAATAVIVALLLIITYRSPLLWIVPLLVVGLADQVAAVSATHVLATFGVAWDESTIGILSVLVFGAGTDYALLLISRYRDELRVQQDRYVAMATAVRGTFEAVLASATTVTLGLLTLLLSVVPTTRGLGLACAVGVVIAASYALIVLPCALVLFGRWVFWPLVPRVGQEPLVDSRTSAWHRLGTTVSRRPRGFALGAIGVVALLGLSVTQIEQGLPTSEQFLDTPESISAATRLGESFPAGTVDPATVITRSDPGQVTAAIEQGDDVVSVRITGQNDDLTRLAVVFDAASNTTAAETAVVDLRDRLDGFDDTWVGGTEAQSVDERDAAERDRALLIPLILGLVIIGLVLLLRSIVAPLLLVATVVGTFFAALGTSWWIYTGVFGFSAIDVGVPLLAFLFLVALGVDYNIFLITRALEESRAHGLRDGMLRGLTATGGVITSAGILLASVFAVLGVLPLVVLAQLGIVIFVGVLLDTLLVRTVLVPALSLWLGPTFWWPRRPGAITGERTGPA
ncbi:MMPL family transporter [Nocardioides sp. CCNWLW239]|uniref:MMPL family transporter n=1 Tax=Nocardioides sp. CCNWLW239 TaxID=3128902 RepID=UPI0030185AC7